MKIKLNIKSNIIDYILNFAIILLIIILMIVIFNDNTKDTSEEEKIMNEDSIISTVSEDVFNAVELDGFEFTTSPVVPNGAGGYRIEVNVKNISDKTKKLSGFTLIIKDENNNKVDTLSYFEYMEFNSEDSMIYMLDCDQYLLKDNYNIEYRPSYMISE